MLQRIKQPITTRVKKTVQEKTDINIITEETNPRKGEILLLQTGDLVSADLKLLEASGLEVDEFELTGEIMPVGKKIGGEKDVFVYNGSRVIRGSAKGVVIATGAKTEYGKILSLRYKTVTRKSPPLLKKRSFLLPILLVPPFIIDLCIAGDPLFTCLTYIAMATILVFIQNRDLFKFIILSREVEKLKRRHVQFHDETALEGIGTLDVMCFDKTGVLTTQEIEVKRVHLADSTPDRDSYAFNLIRIACALCNDVIFLEKAKHADPIDRALMSFASSNGVNINEIKLKYKRIFEKPFDSEQRYMASGFEFDGDKKSLFLVKGDPEIIIKLCRTYITGAGDEKQLDLGFTATVNPKNETLNREGFRTIAMAYHFGTSSTPPSHYTFLCLLQLENPVKPGAREVVKALKENGIRPIMLTGDRSETAMKISSDAGIDYETNPWLTGNSIAQMDLSEIGRQSDYVTT